MKIRFLVAALVCCLAVPTVMVAAQAKKKGEKKAAAPKSASEQAFDAFQKIRFARGAKQDQAQFQKVIGAGLDFLAKYPTSGRASEVSTILGISYPLGIDAKRPELRVQYLSLLRLDATNRKYKEGVTEPVKAALAAVDAAAADCDVRMAPNLEAMRTLREKIDALGETPAGYRFLTERERAYAHLMILMRQAARAEEQLTKLSQHKEKAVADMAKQELNILNVTKAPFELKFTGLDGKPVDLAQFRGKAVALYFWSSANKSSTDLLQKLQTFHSMYRKKGFEVVTVSFDKAEDRTKLEKFVKDRRVTFPVHFDGKQAKNEFSPKLNVTSVPRLLLFNKEGILTTSMIGTSLSSNYSSSLGAFEAEVKKMLNIKK